MSAHRSFYIPVSRGVFEHRKRIGSALWEFMFLLDRVTVEIEEGGATLGLVANGEPLPVAEITAAVCSSLRTVRRNLDRLRREGYIRVEVAKGGDANTYAVLNCKKFKAWGVAKNGHGGWPDVARGEAKNGQTPWPKMAGPLAQNGLHYKESNSSNRRQYCRIAHSTPSTADQPEAKTDFAEDSGGDLTSALGRVWDHYIQATGRDGRTYRLTDARRRKGMDRLRDCLTVACGDPQKAIELMTLAVDRLAASDWHMGRDPKTNGKRYCEWETNLFGSVERLEKWWQQ